MYFLSFYQVEFSINTPVIVMPEEMYINQSISSLHLLGLSYL